MSVLDKNIEFTPDPAIEATKRLIGITKNSFRQMANSFNEGTRVFWANPDGATPEQIATLLGADAGEIFMLHYKLGLFLSDVKPEAIQESLAMIGNFTINPDGTVTILPPVVE
jgi:hypothetical protein